MSTVSVSTYASVVYLRDVFYQFTPFDNRYSRLTVKQKALMIELELHLHKTNRFHSLLHFTKMNHGDFCAPLWTRTCIVSFLVTVVTQDIRISVRLDLCKRMALNGWFRWCGIVAIILLLYRLVRSLILNKQLVGAH